MRRISAAIVGIACLLALGLQPAAATGGAPQRWIVQLETGARVSDVASSARSRLGIRPGQRFGNVLNGFAALMTPAQRKELAADPRVRLIVPDLPIRSAGDPYPLNPAELQPGITRVGATGNEQRDGASLDVDIAVLDTGIQPDNHELNVFGGYNCTDNGGPTAFGDGAAFGHGTHVSGIAAAKQNGRGVAGVAQGARLWAIKVLNANGNGYWSWVICGLDRVAQMRDTDGAQTIEVVNMSLAAVGADDGDCGFSNHDLLHQAVCRVNEAGVTMVVAAGNASRDASGYIPGAYDEVITVAAMADWNGMADNVASPPAPGSPPTGCSRTTPDDAFGGFSNFGADIDLIAPGTCVLSTLPVDRLGLMTGTSMATPHVAGGAALYYLAERAAGRGRPTPEQVRAALVAKGTLDWKTGSDPDRNRAGSVREPALFVGNFSLQPFFDIGVRRQIVRAQAGSSLENKVWVARVAGFGDSVNLTVDESSLPDGAQADIESRTLSLDLPANATPGTYNVVVTGRAGVTSRTVRFRLVVYGTASDAGGPVMSLRQGAIIGVVTMPVRVSWARVSNATRYALSRSVDGGEWVTIGRTAGLGLNVTVNPGVRYQFRVRARVGGTWRDWKAGRSSVVTVYEPAAPVALDGIWKQARVDDSHSEVPVFSTAAGASATLAFNARSVGWIGSRGPTRGKAQVRVDGSLASTIDTYAGTKRNRVVLFARSWSSVGSHTLRLTVLGQPTSRPRVDVDAIVVVTH